MDERYIKDAENSLAGCLLAEPAETLREIKGIVFAADCQNPNSAAVFSAASALINSGKPCDPVLIQEEAARAGLVLSNDYCRETLQMYVTTAVVAVHAQIVHDAALRRSACRIGMELAEDELTPLEAVGRLQELLTSQSSKLHSPMEAANTVMDFISEAASGQSRPFLSSGYASLDRQLAGGLVAGGLITLAARPGTGKTTAALNLAENIAAAGGKVLYISLEMTEAQLWACRAANLSGLSRSGIYRRPGTPNDPRWQICGTLAPSRRTATWYACSSVARSICQRTRGQSRGSLKKLISS